MRRSTVARALGLALAAGAALLPACKSDAVVSRSPGAACATPPSDKTVCAVAPGEFPPPDCDPSAHTCGTGGACTIDETKCGARGTCLPLASNQGRAIQDFRIRRLSIAAPDALAALPLQKGVITRDIDLPNKECGEVGLGTFNWLFRVDRTKSRLTTGGAPRSADPFGAGFCFHDHDLGGTRVGPASGIPLTMRGDTFTSSAIPKLTIPIFREDGSAILLPLSDVTFNAVTLSANGDCVGSFDDRALAADCTDDAAKCSKWKTAGAIAAHITLEEADSVAVPELGASLCVVLTKTSPGADGKCARVNGKIQATGDYCAATAKACDCQDSFWLAATFAASAVTINDGTTVKECAGGGG
jgi:hypothetical protein